MWICRVTGQHKSIDDTHLCDSLIHENGDRFDGLSLEQQRSIIGEWPPSPKDKKNAKEKAESPLLDMLSVQRISQQMNDIDTVEGVKSLLPIVPDINDKVKLSEFELDLEKLLPHLQYVCHQPQLRLEVEEEVLPISRAKRWSNRAIPHLLSHPEHWDRKTLTGVQPSHLLSKVIVDRWDLYENRIAVRLIELLIRYLSRRIQEIQQIKDLNNFTNFDKTSYWRRKERIYSLWGEGWNTDDDQVDATLQKLILLRNRVLGLKQTPLCKRVSDGQSNSSRLKGTNILNNDPHYRKVRLLWTRLFESDPHLKQKSEKEQKEGRMTEGKAWENFVYLLVLRGFFNIGWTNVEGDLSSELHISKTGWKRVSITRNQYGIIRLTCQSTTFIVAPICANLEDVQGEKFYTESQEQILLVHPGKTPSKDTPEGTGWHFNNPVAFLNVSPWGLDSEEKMTRVIQVWLAKFAFPALPVVKELRKLPTPAEHSWYTYHKTRFTVTRYPTPLEKEQLRKWAQEWIAKLAQPKKGRRQTENNHSVPNLKELLELVDSTELEGMTVMSTCPISVCGSHQVNDPYSDQQHVQDWKRSCTDCRTEWGIRTCRYCEKIYPFLSIYGENLEHKLSVMQTPDDVFGSETWAYPRTANDRRITVFTCSFCGQADV